MRVNVGVCGIFHHRKYIGLLSQRGVLQAFYYSHQRSTTAETLGIVQGHAYNLFPKEYLYHGADKLLRETGTRLIGPLAHDLWQWQMLRKWEPCDIFQVMLHGTAVKALKRAKREGAITIGEPVNAHPEVLHQLMVEEHAKLGLPKLRPLSKPDRRLVAEVAESDVLLVASNWMKRSFVAKGYAAERIIVEPFASDRSKFYPLTAEERLQLCDGKFRVICVAQLNARKGQSYLLEAWKKLGYSKNEAELVLIGVPSTEYEQVMGRYSGLFTHKARVDHSELRKEFGRASVKVLPSVEDGFGMVGVEAMACGIPLITTENAGVADVVENGRSGYVVPARDADALAERIERLRVDHVLRASMGVRSLELSQTSLSWATYVDRLVGHYERLMRERQGSPAV